MEAVSKALDVQPRVFVSQANALVERRNNIHVYFSSREALDNEVTEVLGLINEDLRHDIKWECMVVENYNAIKDNIAE